MNDDERNKHLNGILYLIEPVEKNHAKRAFINEKSRKNWLKRLAHGIEMHPDYTYEPPKGYRSEEALIKTLYELGAKETCYIIASDSSLDDTFQKLNTVIPKMYEEFGHGTIFSCTPGKLALFRTSWPHKHLIIHRKLKSN